MLTADDLGSGWAEQTDSPESACVGAAVEDIGPVAAVPANGFELEGSSQEARSQAWAFADEETATTAFNAATSDTVIQCFADAKLADLQATGQVEEEDVIDATSEALNLDVGDEFAGRAGARAGSTGRAVGAGRPSRGLRGGADGPGRRRLPVRQPG